MKSFESFVSKFWCFKWRLIWKTLLFHWFFFIISFFLRSLFSLSIFPCFHTFILRLNIIVGLTRYNFLYSIEMRFEIFTLKWETIKRYWRTKFTLFRIFRRWATRDQIFTIVKCLTSISRLTERWVSVPRCNVCWESSSRWSATRTEKPISRKK